jgi:hypothetical protein
MINIEISMPGLEEKLGKIRKWDSFTKQRFETAMNESVLEFRSEVLTIVKAHSSMGLLKDSFWVKVGVGSQPGSVIGKLGSSANYAYYANYGRGPGKPPPIQPIIDWVHRKKIAGVYSIKTSGNVFKGGHRRLGGAKRQAREDLAVAYLIKWHIAKHGTKPINFMENGLKAATPAILANFNKALDLIVEDLT